MRITKPVWIAPDGLVCYNEAIFRTLEESVTPAKQAKLVELAQTYLQEHSWEGDWRIDVVAVEMTSRGKLLRVELIKNAVTDWGLL